MIKIDIPKDVTTYKEHFFFGFTTRQLVSMVLMLAFGIITFILAHKYIDNSILMYIIIFGVAPLAAFGFFEYNGMNVETIAVKVITFYASKQRRKLKYVPQGMDIHNEVRKIALSEAEKERKAELKELKAEKKRNKKVSKSSKKDKKNRSVNVNA